MMTAVTMAAMTETAAMITTMMTIRRFTKKIKKFFSIPRFWESDSVIYKQKQEISTFLKQEREIIKRKGD